MGGLSILAAAAVTSGVLYFRVMGPALAVQVHTIAMEDAAAVAREKRHSLPSDAQLYEYKQHIDALVELGHFEKREFRLPMDTLRENQGQLFRQLERKADGLPLWDWKPTLEKDAIVITVHATPSDMKNWESLIERYG
jgi:hypothetical protein